MSALSAERKRSFYQMVSLYFLENLMLVFYRLHFVLITLAQLYCLKCIEILGVFAASKVYFSESALS